MSRLTRIGIALSYVSLAAVPLYGASSDTKQVQDIPAVSTPTAPRGLASGELSLASAGAAKDASILRR